MRTLAGFLVFNGVALALGLAILYAAGLVRPRLLGMVTAAGAALLAGLGAIALAAMLGVIAGLGMDIAVLTALALAATGALVAVGRRRAPRSPAAEDPPARLAYLLVGAVALFVGVQLLESREVPVAWDAAHIWTIKAFALSDSAQLTGQLFTDGDAFAMAHLDYPLGWPALGAVAVRFGAAAEQGVLIGQLWVILGAVVLAVPWLLGAGRWTGLALAPMALAAVSAPSAGLLRGDADVPMACFLAAGAVALARLLETSRRGYAVYAALCLAMAANTKNEGTAFVAGVLVVAFAVALVRRRRDVALAVTAAGAAVALLAAPWRLWTAANGPFANDVAPLSDSLDAGYLVDHLPQLDLGAQTLLARLTEPGAQWLVPAFLAVAAAALAARRSSPLAAAYLGTVLASVLAVLWVYWTSQVPGVAGHIERTSIRTITGPLFLAAAGLAHLLPRMLAPVQVDAPPPLATAAGAQVAAAAEPELRVTR